MLRSFFLNLRYLINKLIYNKTVYHRKPSFIHIIDCARFIDLLHISIWLRQLQLRVYDSAYKIITEPTYNSLRIPKSHTRRVEGYIYTNNPNLCLHIFGHITICWLDLEIY
jgi:hypothetical protein